MTYLVLLTTDDGRDPAYAAMREGALGWARSGEYRVVLYDRSAESYFVDPYPNGAWAADVDDGPTRERLLSARDLEIVGRHYLADQVRQAEAGGLEVSAWLPPTPGTAGMAEAIDRFGVDVVILPASMSAPSLVDRVRGNTLDRFRSALAVDILVGDAGGVHSQGSPTRT